jgi:hypothetical protein
MGIGLLDRIMAGLATHQMWLGRTVPTSLQAMMCTYPLLVARLGRATQLAFAGGLPKAGEVTHFAAGADALETTVRVGSLGWAVAEPSWSLAVRATIVRPSRDPNRGYS